MFANPWALLLLLLAAPIAWLYRRPCAVPRSLTATGEIWRRVLAEERTRSWWLPRRRAVSLAVQLLLLLLFVLALAEPRFSPPRTTILVLDTSGSMNAADVSPSRFELARRCSLRLVDSLPAGDRLGILTGGSPVRVVCPPSHDRRQLREALEAVRAGAGPTLVTDAVAIARRMLDGRQVGRVVVLSDACFPGASDLARADDVDLYTVGGAAPNVAARRVAARRDPIEPETVEALVEVASHPAMPAGGIPTEMRLDGDMLETARVEGDTGSVGARVVALPAAKPGVFSALAKSNDALPADNHRSARLPPANLLHVASVGPLSRFIEAAFEGDRRVRLLKLSDPQSPRDAGTVLVMQGEVPPQLPAGPILLVAPSNSCDLFELDGTIARAAIGRQDVSSSIGDGLDLEGITLSEVGRLEFRPDEAHGSHVVAATAEGVPLLATFERREGRVVVLLGGPDTSELSHHAEFSLLLVQAIDWLVEEMEPGETTCVARDGGAFAASESDLRAAPDSGIAADTWEVPDPKLPPWLFLAVPSLALLLVEWCLYQRRWIS